MSETHTTEKKEKKIPVVEIFGPTIEGEGAVIGSQTMFIRFGLCDYKCKRCDSMHAVDPKLVKKLAKWMTQKEIATDLLKLMARTNSQHIKHVTFSGGNPAIHDLEELVAILKENGKTIIVETQGTKFPKWLERIDHLVVSPKAPGMGEKFEPEVFKKFLLNALGLHQNAKLEFSIKIVVFGAQDVEHAAQVALFAKSVASIIHYKQWEATDIIERRFFLSLGNARPPIFQEEGDEIINNSPPTKALVLDLLSDYNILAEQIMKDKRLGFARFLPQLHALVWGNETEK